MTEAGAARIEWALGVVSGLVVLAVIGLLVRGGLRDIGAHPELSARLEAPAGDAGQVRFTVLNAGGRTARSVTVAVALEGADATQAVRRLVIDYVPAEGEVHGGFLLSPGTEAAEVVVEGYLDP